MITPVPVKSSTLEPEAKESTMFEQQKNRPLISMTCEGHIFHNAHGSTVSEDVAAPTYVVIA